MATPSAGTVAALRLRSSEPPLRGVLHLLWDGRDVLAWVELRPQGLPGVGVPGDPAPTHPFAADSVLLGDMLGLRRTGRPRPRPLVLTLPSRLSSAVQRGWTGLVPVPSPPLGGPAGEVFPLQAFTVPSLPVPRERLAGLLFGAPRPAGAAGPLGGFPSGLAMGGDVAHWRRIARLALGVCAQGAFVPATLQRGGPAWAGWQPVGPVPELAALAAALPPACLGAAGGLSAGALAESFFEMGVDLAVRACLGPARAGLRRRLTGTGAAERWALGLLQESPLPLPLGFDRRLGRSIAAWAAAAAGLGAAPTVGLVLRLEDPLPDGPAGSGPAAAAAVWPLTVLVQTGEAAHRLADLCGAPERAPAGAAALRAAALRALHASARAFPPLARAAADPAAAALALTPEEALSLLDAGAAALRAEGTEVVVPAWWRQAPVAASARLHLGGTVATHGGEGALSLAGLASFRWEAAIGGEELDAPTFEALVRSRQPLVRLRTGWVRVDPAALRRVAEQWEETGAEGRLPGLGALRLALEARRPAPGAAVGAAPAVQVEGAVTRWLERLPGERPAGELPEPQGFRGTLRPYQRQGLGWLAALAAAGLGGCLADDMGLGKTVQVLALLAHRRAAGQAEGPTLLVCPTSVLANWQAEQRRFAPDLVTHLHHGAGRPRGPALAQLAAASDLILTSYSLLVRDRQDLAAVAWDGVVLDEAQNVKNPLSLQSQAARALRAGHRFALTGTPVENGLGDIWAIFAFALPGYLGPARAFGRTHAAGEAKAMARLRAAIAPFVLRRTKRDPEVARELPEKIETRHDCPLTPEQAALYAGVLRQSLERIAGSEGLRRRAAVLTTLLRLKQICNHPALFLADGGPLPGRSGKLDRLEAILDDLLAAGESALIFTQFAAWARRLAAHLAAGRGCPVLCLDGAVPAQRREELVRAFQEGERPALFILSLHAGGTGLNLTAAQHVIHFDRWWNPAVEAQATDRAHRLGQRRTVQVHRLVAPGTLEERIDALLASKAALAAQVVGGGGPEAALTELGTEALREWLALRSREGDEG